MANVKELITAVTKAVPGSPGIAQVGQIVHYTLDALCSLPLRDLDQMLARRRKVNAAKIKRSLKALKGSASCTPVNRK